MKDLTICILLLCSMALGTAAEGPKGNGSAPLTSLDQIHPQTVRFEVSDDGNTFLALRLRRNGAAAVRVQITEMRLMDGETVYIYSPDRSRVYGPFSGNGPTHTGEFWSEAIAGSDLVVEFQAGRQVPADLPFRVMELKEVDLSEIPELRVIAESAEDSAFEGDMLLMPEQLGRVKKSGAKTAVAITGSRYRWPSGIMPYVISDLIPNQARIEKAISHWNSVMAGYVQMVPRTNEANYVGFYFSPNAGTCTSNVGMTGFGGQAVNVGNYCSTGNIIHEIGHAWGLWHEHTRADRDEHVQINWDNIQSSQVYNFNQNGNYGQDIARYDFNSIMHYNATSFSSNGKATIETKPAGIPIGQRVSLSTGDIEAIRLLYPYGPPPASKVKTTVTSNPVGLPVVVDGVDQTTPATFEWVIGSSHVVSALDNTSNGTRRQFSGWSDGGARTHSFTASSTTAMLKADYTVSYSVTAAPSLPGSGIVKLTPESNDGFYVSGNTVKLSAQSEPGYCFTGWTGLVAGTPDKTNLFAARPYNLVANFQPGSISLTLSTITAFAVEGSYRVGLSATSGCMWSISPSAPWVSVTTAPAGTGSTSVWLHVDPNPSTTSRMAHVVVGDQLLPILQLGK